MKTKQFPIAVTLACVLWMSAHEAEAFYNPSTGRWLSRDPIEEKAGPNLLCQVKNDTVNGTDHLGLFHELWYGNHVVVGKTHHSKLWLITDEPDLPESKTFHFKVAVSKTESWDGHYRTPLSECNLWFIAIGAGPKNAATDELLAEFNRELDVKKDLSNPQLVASFDSSPRALAFLFLVNQRNKVMNRNFDNTTLEYDLYPDPSYTSWGWDEFNSNSYISGLLKSFGYSPPPPNAKVPGYEKPVPILCLTSLFHRQRS